ncbi:MAG TPA: TadE family protein [Terracidiphilus sp.]|nr:TadE family protein [Terracidiphilus sp.]
MIKTAHLTRETGILMQRDWEHLNRISFSIGEQHIHGASGDEGSAIVEMAVVSSLLFAVLFGIIELSLALYTYNYVSDAAREATRYAIVRGSACTQLTNCGVTSAQVQSYVRSLGYPGMTSTNTTATTTWYSPSSAPPTTWTACGTPCNAPGDAVQVKVTYSFPLSIPFVPKSTLSLKSTSLMVIAN